MSSFISGFVDKFISCGVNNYVLLKASYFMFFMDSRGGFIGFLPGWVCAFILLFRLSLSLNWDDKK
jgi:hypothetical protein